jgi:hypothetical protein
MNMNHPLRVMLPLAGFCVAFAVMAQTPPNQPANQTQQPPATANQPTAAPQVSPQPTQPTQPTQPSMALGGSNNDNQVNQHKAQLRQQAIQMIEQGLNNLRQAQ